MLNYFKIINNLIRPDTLTYKIYIVHCVLVTNKALEIGRCLNLSQSDLEFIEEASMLHDIGVIKVKSPKMGCRGELAYICHGAEGRKILEGLNLPKHALVAERHVGVGITQKDIEEQKLHLPLRNMSPQTLVEKIITYSDLFFSKREQTLWLKDSSEEVISEIKEYGFGKEKIFLEWQREFENEIYIKE
jgi:uncharacterized protein